MQRLIAIGDIHGQYDLLVELLDQVVPTVNDRLVFLGDYIDRGAKTPQVLDWLLDFKAQYPQTVLLRGNHEQMLLDALQDIAACESRNDGWLGKLLAFGSSFLPETAEFFIACGGLETLLAYRPLVVEFDPLAAFASIPQSHIDFLRTTRFFFQQGQFLFVHAGVDPNDPQGKISTRSFLWERRPLWVDRPGWDKVVVHGHTPVAEPYFAQWEVGLDTGAGHHGRLTACDLLTKQIWQAGEGRI